MEVKKVAQKTMVLTRRIRFFTLFYYKNKYEPMFFFVVGLIDN